MSIAEFSGSYSATYGCTGQTGTFALWHKCYIRYGKRGHSHGEPHEALLA